MIRRVLGVTCLVAFPAAVHGQVPGADAPHQDAWRARLATTAWNRSPVGTEAGYSLLTGIPVRYGLAWTAGNPAALPWEMADSWSGLAGSFQSTSGDYRRPLDVRSAHQLSASGLAWGEVSTNRAAIGSVEVGHTSAEPGSEAVTPTPYENGPFLIADAEIPRLRRTHVVLDGALGSRFGEWGVGIALGYTAAEERTQEHPVVRFVRDIGFAGTVGLLREMPNHVRVGFHGSAVARRETTIVSAQRQSTEVRPFVGYGEPDVIALVQPDNHFRRTTGRDLGITASVADSNDRWLLYAGTSAAEERGVGTRMALPATAHDSWSTRGARFGVGATLPLAGSLKLFGQWRTATGHAFTPGIDEEIYVISDSRLESVVTWQPSRTGAWQALAAIRLSRVAEQHRDRLVGLSSDLVLWSPGGSVTVAREMSPTVAIELSYSVTAFRPVGTIPSLDRFGELAREITAGGLTYYTLASTPQYLSTVLRWKVRSVDLIVSASYAWVVVGSDLPSSSPRSAGTRSTTFFQLAIRP